MSTTTDHRHLAAGAAASEAARELADLLERLAVDLGPGEEIVRTVVTASGLSITVTVRPEG